MLRTILLEPVFNVLLFLYAVVPGGDFGVSVILLTIIIRILLWPLMKKQIHHQQAMKELQPEIEKVKKKAKGDKQKESQMMMELFKEKELNPFSSIGLALLQFPILITLFFVLREVVVSGKIAENTYSFLSSLPPIQAIINNPEAFDPTLFGIVDLAHPNIVLAGLAGLAQFAQVKQMTPSNTAKAGSTQKTGLNIMQYLPLVTVVVATQFPAALALYWTVSSAFAVMQQHIILAGDVSLAQKMRLRRPKSPAETKPAAKKAPEQSAKTTKKQPPKKPAAKKPNAKKPATKSATAQQRKK